MLKIWTWGSSFLVLPLLCAQLTEPAHTHSRAQQSLAAAKLSHEAKYCDEENTYVQCFRLMAGQSWVTLKSANVAHVLIYGNELSPSRYFITVSAEPLPVPTAMAAYSYNIRLWLRHPAKRETVLQVILPGATNYHPRHAEDH